MKTIPASAFSSVVALGLLMFLGCAKTSEKPSDEAVNSALVSYYQENLLNAFVDPSSRFADPRIGTQQVENVAIKNYYTQKFGDDIYQVFDTEVIVKFGDCNYHELISIALIKRGNDWKWMCVGTPKTKILDPDENPELKARLSESARLNSMYKQLEQQQKTAPNSKMADELK
jgi:hypothetical protein